MKYKNILIVSSCLISILCIFFFFNTKLNWINTDIIEIKSIRSFNTVIKTVSNNVKQDNENGLYILTSPDQEAQLIWSNNYVENDIYNIMINLDLKPFVDAGLDITKINGVDGITVIDNSILISGTVENKNEYKNGLNAIDSFEQILKNKRENLNYHSSLDHFGITVGNGNAFEWAQNINKNDKDIVFAINPEPFLNAGVNPDNINGWVYTKVKTMDNNGKNIEITRFLKVFDVK